MSKPPFFSIILPAFNAGMLVARTLNSIVSQDFTDYELLVVNDGSTDNTLEICKEFASAFSQVKLIDKINEGVAVARNEALQIARGEYILFVDADDILYAHALRQIYDELQADRVDYLRYEFQTIDNEDKALFPNYEARQRQRYERRVVDGASCIQLLVRGEFFLWASAFRRQIIEDSNLHFVAGCTYNEDTLFITQYLVNAKRCSYIGQVLYGYRKTDGAVTAHFTIKNLTDVIAVYEQLMRLARQQKGALSMEIQKTAQQLALHIYEERNLMSGQETCNKVFDECMKQPLTFEWKTMSWFGHVAEYLWKTKIIATKILRRL